MGASEEVIGTTSSYFKDCSRCIAAMTRPPRPKKGSFATTGRASRATAASMSSPRSTQSSRCPSACAGVPSRTYSCILKICMRVGSIDGS